MSAAVRIGLIGVGRHGSRYAHHLTQDPLGARLVALARRHRAEAERQAAQYGCKAYDDWRALVAAAEVDAVVAVVPPTLHPEIVAAAAAAKKPLLLEKPAAATVAAGCELLACAEKASLPVMVAQTLRYNGVVQELVRALPQIGSLHALRLGQHFEPSRPGWIDDPTIAGGGMLLHTGVHCFDLVRFVTGMEVERVSCAWSRVNVRYTDDNFAALLVLADGRTLATVGGSRATASRSGGIEIAGERGQLIADHVLNRAWLVQGSEATPLAVPLPVPTVREVLREFVQAVHRGQRMPIPLEEGLRAVAIVEACYWAAANGCMVAVPPILTR